MRNKYTKQRIEAHRVEPVRLGVRSLLLQVLLDAAHDPHAQALVAAGLPSFTVAGGLCVNAKIKKEEAAERNAGIRELERERRKTKGRQRGEAERKESRTPREE